MTYLGPDGLEEMHVFFALAWFDLGSWAWMHYINEWGTKGIFMVSWISRPPSDGEERLPMARKTKSFPAADPPVAPQSDIALRKQIPFLVLHFLC